ncbi:hypothetical protein AC578_3662 [Pseudocercospora eumusae]|uniref:Uncharacterized protein n=1 Tax=Pseudocercospora eumusae TaxID=321146 RepID=A0A139GXB2_9PEZI|nr:hypothetical protein AC578_3662 [Pseudocercospora eumusae]
MPSSNEILKSSQYAHQQYVQIDTPSTVQDQRRSLIAAHKVTEILHRRLDASIRWAFRGYIAYRCIVPNDIYSRYTDDLDIIVDSKEFGVLDTIERVLLDDAPEQFTIAKTPSKLSKVHYKSVDGTLVRLDIYNTAMRNTGGGHYHGLEILNLMQPQQFVDVPAFMCPCFNINALVDIKLVAYLDTKSSKHLDDAFFAMWCVPMAQNKSLPWYSSQCQEGITLMTAIMRQRAAVYPEEGKESSWSPTFIVNMDILSDAEKNVPGQ